MAKKIILGAVLLILVGGAYLWWRGDQTLRQAEARKVETARQAQSALDAFNQKLDASLRAVSTTTLAVAGQAIIEKQAPLARLDPATLAKAQYSFADLKLASTETSATRQTYQTGLKKILTKYSQNLIGDEMSLMLSYLNSRDSTTLIKLKQSWQNLDTAITALLKQAVPPSASFLHLQLLNSLASLRQIIYNMSEVATEPLLATQSADQRAQKYLDVVAAISALDRYLAHPIIP